MIDLLIIVYLCKNVILCQQVYRSLFLLLLEINGCMAANRPLSDNNPRLFSNNLPLLRNNPRFSFCCMLPWNINMPLRIIREPLGWMQK